MANVIQEVVAHNWCKGCGLCVAVCPQNRLEMRWNSYGCYQPFELDKDCLAKCSLCYDVCPAHGNNANESELGKDEYGLIEGINYSKEMGYWLNTYVGYYGEQRLKSASGGLATYFLEKLLKQKLVDGIITVKKTENREKLFSFTTCHTVSELKQCARSAYYPVEIGTILREVLSQTNKKYAIMGLPCVCKGVRLAQKRIPKLKSRFPYVLGLVCGRQCSKYFAEFVCALGGGDPYKLQEISFRDKDLDQPANNLLMRFSWNSDGSVASGKKLWWDGIGSAFTKGFFQPNSCFFCDDVFAECADAVFMDAWLSEYVDDPKGNSLVITRNQELNMLLRNNVDDICIEDIESNKVVQSQRGVLYKKRVRRLSKKNVPILRSEIIVKASLVQHGINCLRKELACKSISSWHQSKNCADLHKRCIYAMITLKILQKLHRLID